MSTLRMTSDLRRQLILGAAKRCFARNGFAGTTTKSVAAAAAISEGAAVQALPVQGRALCGDPGRGMRGRSGSGASARAGAVDRRRWSNWSRAWSGTSSIIPTGPTEEEAQRLRLMTTSHLDDGEFARLLYAKVEKLIGSVFTASLERAIAAGDAVAARQRAAQSVLVCPSHRADGRADAAAGRAVSRLRQRRRSRTAALRISPPRHRT